MKKVILILVSIWVVLGIGFYSTVIFLVPALVNSDAIITKVEKFIEKSGKIIVDVDDLYLDIEPDFDSEVMFKSLKIINKDKIALEINNFKLITDNIVLKNIEADYINLNIDELKATFSKKNKTTKCKKKFNIDKLPKVNIKKLIVSKDADPQLLLTADDILLSDNKLNLKMKLKLDRLLNELYLGDTGTLKIQNNDIVAENYSVILGTANFYLNGTLLDDGKVGNFNLEGKHIQVGETMKTLLFLQKFTDPTKKFIENFKNYKGDIYLIAYCKNGEFSGYAKLTNVSANTVLFNIPLRVPVAEFFMKDNEVNSFASGFAGNEVITHKLHMVNIMSKDRIAFGEVRTKLTKSLIETYLPKTYDLYNYIDFGIGYRIQHRKVGIKYKAYMPVSTVISIGNFYSGIKGKERIVTAETFKDGVNLYLKSYKYSYKDKDVYKDILTGNGLFINDNGKMFPQYITCVTNGYVPNSFTGSFGNYVIGGQFNGTLRYDFPQQQITGNFEVINTIFNDFNVKSAKVIADKKLMKVDALGTYKNQKFLCKGDAKNDFRKKIYVNNMDLFLDKYILKTKSAKAKKSDSKKLDSIKFDIDTTSKEISSQVKKINMDIDKWRISGNLIQFNNIIVKDIELNGYLKNSVFKYNIPQILLANGIITANGLYDFNVDKSIIDFSAKNIDSNVIATQAFNFPNQVAGSANATLHSETSKNLSNWKAYATFEIDNGALPHLENFEFANGNDTSYKKLKISDYVTVDANKKGDLNSKITGSFRCDDYKIYDADVRLQHEFVSLLINGDYNYITGQEHAFMYGKYDSSVSKKVKVLKIPVNWLINLLIKREKSFDKYEKELLKIPPIGIPDDEAKYFMVSLVGNPRKNKFDFYIKIIKK